MLLKITVIQFSTRLHKRYEISEIKLIFFSSSEISVTFNRHYITVIPFSTFQLFFMYIDLPDFAVTPTVYTIIFFQREKLYNCGSICYSINNLPTFLQFTNKKSDGTYI